ncbi:hypothetical protein QRD43_22375 [Pelomonas sp. APW6]|uniref:Uncharacterized protein n=1 Tax=Roseateles subflavus TaxID=3053353 RepID=A0ABT7LP61_9BURK|nr:hypothetical protein [Pelomonas sp. APW6]MDL5034666.1 hypothetical protein [Pelomonas sp. APW6]
MTWALVATSLCGGALAEPLSWSGELGASVWSSNRQLDQQSGVGIGRARLELEAKVPGGAHLRIEGWAMNGAARQEGSAWGLKEAYAQWRQLPCQPSVGKRFVSWGKTDVFTPTDLLSPHDLTRLVARETDQRDGVVGLHGSCVAGPGRLAWHLLDRFKSSHVPLPNVPGVTIQRERPSVSATQALRYEVSGEGLDWSVSAIRGHDVLPTISLRNAGPAGMVLGLRPSAMRMLGVDAATSVGAWVFRGELAVVDYPDRSTAPGAMLTAERRPYAMGVLGAELGLGDREAVTFQIYGRRMRAGQGAVSPASQMLQSFQELLSNELDRHQHGFSVRYATPFAESRADADLLLVWSRPRNDWFLRSRLNYAYTDAMRITIGVDLLRGPPDSFLGNLRRNTLAFAELSTAW